MIRHLPMRYHWSAERRSIRFKISQPRSVDLRSPARLNSEREGHRQ